MAWDLQRVIPIDTSDAIFHSLGVGGRTSVESSSNFICHLLTSAFRNLSTEVRVDFLRHHNVFMHLKVG